MATYAECVTVLQTESERLKQYLAALPADAWTTPSACALWEVRDVVAHLTMGIDGFTLRITRGLQGETFSSAKVSVHFSPKGGVTETIVQEIGEAKSQILIQAYSFTSAPP